MAGKNFNSHSPDTPEDTTNFIPFYERAAYFLACLFDVEYIWRTTDDASNLNYNICFHGNKVMKFQISSGHFFASGKGFSVSSETFKQETFDLIKQYFFDLADTAEKRFISESEMRIGIFQTYAELSVSNPLELFRLIKGFMEEKSINSIDNYTGLKILRGKQTVDREIERLMQRNRLPSNIDIDIGLIPPRAFPDLKSAFLASLAVYDISSEKESVVSDSLLSLETILKQCQRHYIRPNCSYVRLH